MNDVSESTYTWLKQQISAIPKDEGAFLTEADVARRTGAARTPVREALLRLEAEGLVNRIPKRGAYVPPLSEGDIRSVMQA
ncbi:GntR family transcriptional regulator, partial [Bacillus mycoides]|uniref:GntR family transcriptional regulator n=1 Tax=Bacillus mycoides TaxID=1405 RepID=UPI002111717D